MMVAVLILLGLLLSYLLSGLESAVLSVSRAKLRHLAKEGDRAALRLDRIFENPQHLLISILVLNSALNLAIFALLARALADRLGTWGYPLAILLSLPVLILWVEILPKAHFRRAPLRLLLSIGLWPLALIDGTIRPLVGGLGWICRRIAGRDAIDFSYEQPAMSRAAFRDLTALFERDGALDPDETSLIVGVMDFHRLTAGEVMRLVAEFERVESSLALPDLQRLSKDTRFSQFPVDGRRGDPVGLVDVLPTLLMEPDSLEGKTVADFQTEIVTAAPDESAMTVVKRLRSSASLLAVVRNARDEPVGIVTLPDLTERIIALPPD